MLDTRRSLETPEGVELGLSMAGLPARFLAALIDQMVRVFAYSALAMPLAVLGDLGTGLMLIAVFLGEWFYPVLFDVFGRGSSPGKRALGLTVLHDDGTPVSWTASMLRNLLRPVDFLPVAYGFGIVSMLLSKDFQRLGDKAAGTVVVYRQETRRRTELAVARPRPVPVPLSSEEQRALVDFAERLGTWSPERARELAAFAAPLTRLATEGAAETSDSAVDRLAGMANWLVGRR